jgi:hypothetical protein
VHPAGRYVAALLAAGLACATLSSCAPSATGAEGGAGMGMGGAGDSLMDGAVAASRDATLLVAPSTTAAGGLLVDRVIAPDHGWLVVRSTVAPGGVLGSTPVPPGLSENVRIELTRGDTIDVRVALHLDRGRQGLLEYDPASPANSLDRPVFADGRAVALPVALSDYALEVDPGSALLMVGDQLVGQRTLTVKYALLPAAAWLSVNRLEGGVPGQRIGLMSRPAGEWQEVKVPLDGPLERGSVVVTAYSDSGTRGRFDYSESDPLSSADKPLASAGVIVSQRAVVR